MKNIDLLKTQSDFIASLDHQGKSYNTLKNYKTDLNIFNQYLQLKNKDLFLKELTSEQVADYSSFLNNKYNSPNSIRRRVQSLRMYFDYLIGQDIIDTNPIKKILVSPKVVDLPKPTFFYDIKKIKAYLESKIKHSNGHESLLYQRNLILIYLIYGAGLKVSDIERLNVNSINEKGGIYRVLVAPEKRDPFTVKIDKSFAEVYPNYLESLETCKLKDKIEFDNLLFNANPYRILKGGLSARGIEVIFKDLKKTINIETTAKSLRQACIFKWLAYDIPESRIKEWMSVQPKYSLAPFKMLAEREPEKYTFQEI